MRQFWTVCLLASAIQQETTAAPAATREWSGVYPHLAHFNDDNECGTGGVVVWADRLWVVTYSPHRPRGSGDKLYEIDRELRRIVRPESIGGTPANRMIHLESGQLFLGPYAIDRERRVRAIPYDQMPGRPTANARHLTDPAHRIYYATMEEGFYEVDVRTLAVTELYRDANADAGGHGGALLPGYHGKGAYSGHGRLVYANNGEFGAGHKPPSIPSGCLAEWDGRIWNVVRRNQFTEVTGPGGIYGNADPMRDPIWSVGWDHRSVLLMVFDGGMWRAYRLPKATHTYDGAHGWNTEWPRIRDIGEPPQSDFLMTMHGMFWRFPKDFSAQTARGIRPRSTYLKVIGDFCRWDGRLVFGCDDAAKSEFLNQRKAKGTLAGPGQSQSNLWFTEPDRLDELGVPFGRGAVWSNDRVRAGEWSDPFLFAGFERRGVHLAERSAVPVVFEFQVDRHGNGTWEDLRSVQVAGSYRWLEFDPGEKGEWIRVRPSRDCEAATVSFAYTNADRRDSSAEARFEGLARASAASFSGGLVRARGENKRTLHLAGVKVTGGTVADTAYYELGEEMKLQRVEDPTADEWLRKNAAIPQGVLSIDAASVVYVDDQGRRWRLPKGDLAFDEITGKGLFRIDREVVTERDLFNSHGTFFELPAENAGGFAKIRPITTHNRRMIDYASYRGLLVLTGIADLPSTNRHILRSDDGQAAVWVGVVDDLWGMGKPVGRGGPWSDAPVRAGVPSDPYLMTGYDRKRLILSQRSTAAVEIRIEVDITGEGDWFSYRTFLVKPDAKTEHVFPEAFQAYWVRAVAAAETTATVLLEYD